MTITTAPPARTAFRVRGFGTLLRTEARVWLRGVSTVFFSLAFPTVLLVGVGFAIPGMRDVIEDVGPQWDGLTAFAAYVPVILAVAIATPALTTMPVWFASFRERGVLRRLSTTPMRPQGIIAAHLIITVAAIVVAAVIALLAGQLTIGVWRPAHPWTVVLVFLLGVAALCSLGLLVASRASKGSVASGIGSLVYFPMLFFAGVWTPGPIMPHAVAAIARFTPLGATAQAMTSGWFESGFPTLCVLVLVAWTAVLLPLSVRLFRWS
ncbi:MAG TPA: ABC transporter permease [Cellulomonas sp.]